MRVVNVHLFYGVMNAHGCGMTMTMTNHACLFIVRLHLMKYIECGLHNKRQTIQLLYLTLKFSCVELVVVGPESVIDLNLISFCATTSIIGSLPYNMRQENFNLLCFLFNLISSILYKKLNHIRIWDLIGPKI